MYVRCHQFDTLCRFASAESLIVPYNQLIENPKTNRLEPALQTMLRVEPLGTFCNNSSQWCRDVVQCPARLGLATYWCGQKVDGTGVYGKLHTSNELRWMVRENESILETQKIMHFGQQTLSLI